MARPGPAQLARKLGRTPNADWIEVANRPYEGASPDLPRLPRGARYHELVTQWWDMVRHMPHCVRWTPTDWQFALETALMKNHFWKVFAAGELTTTAATEIRRREDMMGTTEEARQKRRIRYVDVDEDEYDDDGPVDPNAPQPIVEHQRRAGGARPVTSLSARRARALREQDSRDTA